MEQAAATAGIDEVEITARRARFHRRLAGGFELSGIYFCARRHGEGGRRSALRSAHAKLQFNIVPRLPVAHPVTGRTLS